jgi:hypothetical protein
MSKHLGWPIEEWNDAQQSSYPEPPWYLEDPDLWDGLGSMTEFLANEKDEDG